MNKVVWHFIFHLAAGMFHGTRDKDHHSHGVLIAPDQMKAMLGDVDLVGIRPSHWNNALWLRRGIFPNAGADKLCCTIQVAMLERFGG
eukprot:CAMPEP_0114645704 /NCGR_PEP_ID=MMETSP0191-20121206/4729_1 /TAXON_ID=126664 /ORGANISM="Sorites sp." /LENGTH=87 /DNA_ID=CAMNT_0001858423 /DNA_START=360 /DNA_END=623 /DNA_ORIENTATION=-